MEQWWPWSLLLEEEDELAKPKRSIRSQGESMPRTGQPEKGQKWNMALHLMERKWEHKLESTGRISFKQVTWSSCILVRPGWKEGTRGGQWWQARPAMTSLQLWGWQQLKCKGKNALELKVKLQHNKKSILGDHLTYDICIFGKKCPQNIKFKNTHA